VTIEPGSDVEVVFLLGQAGSLEAVRELVSRYQSGASVENALKETHRFWDTTCGALQVHTPLLSTDFLLNRWLPYQVLSCRFWGRSALYQSGGAWGFRDQLQDSMAFLYAAPHRTREHLLLSAARQFVEGDVQHWWHPETGMGVRTRCSDDLIWLPYAVANYVQITGDTGILTEEVAFLDGATLTAEEQERLFIPPVSARTAPLWEHCRLALEHGARLGSHGLPLFGSGDWNDGMNLVGKQGRGESVWLAWFLGAVLEAFSGLRPESATQWRAEAAALFAAIEQSSWDGEWYLRGFFDDGSPLGSHQNQEARIDSLPQSWAVIAQNGVTDRARQAMASSKKYLVDENDHLVKLFTPAFDCSTPSPGYVMGYPPGLRENGGQYTHGSLWMALARARMNDGDAAVHLLKLMNPAERTRSPEDVNRYRGEPYVVAADVSAAPGKVGRSGWTWYTGSAGWMYRIWLEEVLGFHLRGDVLTLKPVIPHDWPGFEMTYRHRSATYEINVLRDPPHGLTTIELDGHPVDYIHLSDDGITHHVTVRITTSRTAGLIVKSPAPATTGAGLLLLKIPSPIKPPQHIASTEP
jgi:cyclic beta-1,2-glucan synthetase